MRSSPTGNTKGRETCLRVLPAGQEAGMTVLQHSQPSVAYGWLRGVSSQHFHSALCADEKIQGKVAGACRTLYAWTRTVSQMSAAKAHHQ